MHRAPQAMVARPEPENISINTPRDPNTLSNYNNFRTVHTAVNYAIDFEKRVLGGNVVLDLQSITEAEASEIVLDTSYLEISSVQIDNEVAEWKLAPRFEPYGSPLTVKLPRALKRDESVKVNITVTTTDECTALQWLTTEQTPNGKYPYMFSQCEAIHARSLFPCQDTPDVKSTFNFKLKSPLPVLASGLPNGTEAVSGSDEKIYFFKQGVPMPSYLFAIASGDIVSADIGPRSTVWSGPEEIKDCKWELENDTERFIKTAEKLVYPYAWGTYNVLVLPPSFPYGGMENPVYTFATPTLISGDRENVDVIAHELAHSWSGNLVSCASWEHFWLNEGWTTYLERRIQGAVHGEAHRDFSAVIGWKALQDAVRQYGEDHGFTQLIIDLKGKDPEDAFSSIPYEKGSTFLWYLEKHIGQDKWDKFIPYYFTKYKYSSLDSYDFKATLLSFFSNDDEATARLNEVDWDGWFYAPGYPPKPDFDTTLADECYNLASKWESLANGSDKEFTASPEDIKKWSSSQSVVFLEALQNLDKPLRPRDIADMNRAYGYGRTSNVEISSRFFVLGLKAGSDDVVKPTVDLLGKVGRMKFVRPLYRHLAGRDHSLAVQTFEKNKNFYHPICAKMVEKILFPGDASE